LKAGSRQPVRVLIVDDEKNIRTTLAMCLEGLGCVPQEASTARAAVEQAQGGPFDMAFVDLRLGTESGMDLIPELLSRQPAMDIVVVTAFATIDTAVEAIRRGARDYLPKPFTPAQIRYLVERVRERHRLAQQVFNLRARLTETAPDVDLASKSAPMREALDLVGRAAGRTRRCCSAGRAGRERGCWPGPSTG
jgi:NtrC-family two-component system response regulator AlgB